jgi:hypothetical protein
MGDRFHLSDWKWIWMTYPMRCEEAQQLFDAYLNGELAGSLATELGAHRVECSDCRRALALMEVSGQIIASDRDPVALSSDFTERLLACVETPTVSKSRVLWRRMYVAGPLAAAAVVVLALFGMFDNRHTIVAGDKQEGVRKTPPATGGSETGLLPQPQPVQDPPALQDWVDQASRNIEAKRKSGESLQHHLDLTAQQLMELLDRADQDRRQQEQSTNNGATAPSAPSSKPAVEPKNP